MANNTTLNIGSGGDVIRDLDRSGSGPKTSIVLLDVGGTASEHLIGDSGITMPVSGTVTANAGTGVFSVLPASPVASAYLPVRLTDGTSFYTATGGGGGSNAAASATGSAVPSSAGYNAVNIAGTLRGQTGVNPSGSVYAAQNDLTSVGGATFALGQQLAAASLPIVLTAAQVTTLTPPTTVTANIGTSGSLALDATLTGGTQKTKLVDTGGTNVATVSAGGALKVDASATTQPVSGTVTANIGTSGSLALDATLTGGTQKTKLVDTGGTNVATVSAGGALKVDGSAVTQPVSGTVTANIGTSGSLALDASVTGLQVAQGSTTSGQKGGLTLGAVTTGAPSYTTAQSSPLSLTTGGSLRVDLSGTAANGTAVKVDGSAVTQPVSFGAVATGGATPAHYVSAASTNATSVKGSAGSLYGIQWFNTNTSSYRYVKLYDKASAPTVGTDTPVLIFALAPYAGVANTFSVPAIFSTGIAFAITGGMTDADTTAVAVNEVCGNLIYK